MKIFGGRLDLSTVDPRKLFAADGLERESEALLPSALQCFAEMGSEGVNIAMQHLGTRVDAETNLRECAARYLKSASEAERKAIQRYLEWKLREYAILSVEAIPVEFEAC